MQADGSRFSQAPVVKRHITDELCSSAQTDCSMFLTCLHKFGWQLIAQPLGHQLAAATT